MKTIQNKTAVMTAGLLLAVSPGAWAAISTTDFSLTSGSGTTADPGYYLATGSGSQVIPDNTPTGAGYSLNFASGGPITAISVTLSISGGYNGDLTVYLSHGSQISYLLEANPALSSSGISGVTFVTGTGSPVGTGGGALTGPYTAATDLGTFVGTQAAGDWTLFFADLSPGSASTLTGFNLNITAVPEPVNVALALLGAGFIGVGAVRLYRGSKKSQSSTPV